MYFIKQGDLLLASVLFIVANIGVNGSFVFYESLLPHIAEERELDRVSTAAYAMGYIGGGVLLAINLLMIQQPGIFGLPSGEGLTPDQATLPARLSFVTVAAWWLLFSIPLFRRVPEPVVRREPGEPRSESPVRAAFARLGNTFRELKSYQHAFLMLLAFLIYNDGIGTIIRMAVAYGSEIGIGTADLISSIVIVQFVGVPFAFLFGMLAKPVGAKRCIFLGLTVYTGISVLGYRMQDAGDFLMLAVLVGMVQGGTQALSRSLFASMIPRHKSGEFFGFWAVFEKFAGVFGPLIFAITVGATGSSRNAILAVIGFFVVGGAILAFVDVEHGQRAARAAERSTRPAPSDASA
jgi:UMF1 family MFS transporter